MKILALILPLSLLSACSEEADPISVQAIEEETPYEGVCYHLNEENPQVIFAAATPDEFLESASLAHSRVNIVLADFEGQKGGWVEFTATWDSKVLFFLTHDVKMRGYTDITNAGFEAVPVFPGGCEELKAIREVGLMPGTYKFSFGPTDAEEIGMVYASSAGEHNHK